MDGKTEVKMDSKTAEEVMTGGTECIGERETIEEAARKLVRLGIEALPICGEDNRLKGMLTEHDIVVKVIAMGLDPKRTTAGELGYGKPVTIGAHNTIQEAIKTMIAHDVRRLPVIHEHSLKGVISMHDATASISGHIQADEKGQALFK